MKIRTWQERLDDGTDAITTSADIQFAMGDEIEELREALVELQGKLDSLAMSHSIWLDKTDWVQVTSLPPELGMHRADVLKLRIEDLTERLHKTGERLKLTNARIKEILVSNGFKTYEDYNNDLKPYCYAAIRAIEKEVRGET